MPASAQSDHQLSPAGTHLKSEHVEKREPDEGNKKALAKSDSKSNVQRAKKELDDYNDWGRTADSEWDESNGTLSGFSFELYPWFDFWKNNHETEKLDKEKASLAGKDSMHNHRYQDISFDEFDPIFQQMGNNFTYLENSTLPHYDIFKQLMKSDAVQNFILKIQALLNPY